MNLNEVLANIKHERDELVARIEALRKQRATIGHDIKAAVAELAQANRMILAMEGRKKKVVTQDGESQ